MSSTATLHDIRRQVDERDPGKVSHMVSFSSGANGAPSVVHVERELPPGGIAAYRAARGSGARAFALWADEYRRERAATVTTLSARGGVARYQVLDARGQLIGTLERKKALRGWRLRTRWTVSRSGHPDAVGFKGRIVWWWMWWLLLPFMVMLLVFSVFDGVAGNEGGFARAPRRIRWRAGGQVPLEFTSGGNKLHLHAPDVDWRLAAALVALLRSFGAGSWDAAKK
ncbi:hypothetical protein [Streptomyces sp. WG-D5]